MVQNKTHAQGYGFTEGLLYGLVEQAVEVTGIRPGHAGGSDGVLQDQVPANDEANKFT